MKYALFVLVNGALVISGSITAQAANVPVVSDSIVVPIAIFVTSIIFTVVTVWGISRLLNTMNNKIDRNKRILDETSKVLYELETKVDELIKQGSGE